MLSFFTLSSSLIKLNLKLILFQFKKGDWPELEYTHHRMLVICALLKLRDAVRQEFLESENTSEYAKYYWANRVDDYQVLTRACFRTDIFNFKPLYGVQNLDALKACVSAWGWGPSQGMS